MNKLTLLLLLPLAFAGCKNQPASQPATLQTACNPVDISYRFCVDEPSRREAADPTVTWFRDRYYLFASKSGGYWHSQDLTNWTFVPTNQFPTEEYAPTTVVINDTIYLVASSSEIRGVFKSGNPLAGEWSVAIDKLEQPVWDPAFLLDDDQRLYLYWGCSNEKPTYGVEIDYKNNFAFIGKPTELIRANTAEHGWEVPGDYNTRVDGKPWIEGSWVTKHNGKYYLQYAGPGTEFKAYCDGVYVADNPLGPFQLQKLNPFAYKPEGFIAGAGHGSSFTGPFGNLWQIGTVTISQKHVFERRLALYPAFIDADGTYYCNTRFGDYPYIIPQGKINSQKDIFAGWMLLSYKKPVEVSSAIDTLPACNIADEDIRTYWAAQSGNAGEFAIIDMEKPCDVYAIQLNFAEHNTHLFNRVKGIAHKYKVEYSADKTNWQILIDKSANETDNTHCYTQLPEKVNCRYLKLTNLAVPGGNFALSGFRVFGKGNGSAPAPPTGLTANRQNNDPRVITLIWTKVPDATGYNISYGLDRDHLYLNYLVYSDTTITIRSLDVNNSYCFNIEAFNENGITPGDQPVHIE